jgi:hypothetical protein
LIQVWYGHISFDLPDTRLISTLMCPFQAISFLSLHASFPSFFDLVEKKTVVTNVQPRLTNTANEGNVNAQNSRHCHICELYESSFVQKL